MPPSTTADEYARGGFFANVATNVIGMLIILIVVLGQRAQRVAPTAEVPPAVDDLSKVRGAADAIERDVHNVVRQVQTVEGELVERFREREQLAAMLNLAQRELDGRRGALDEESRRRFDVERELALARADLNRLSDERTRTIVQKRPAERIDNYPTPLSKTVDGHEIHFQLRSGRLAVVPLEELLAKFKSIVHERVWKLKEQPELTETIGPMGGFYFRYTLERIDVPWEAAMAAGKGGSVVQLSKYELIPVSGQLGEPIDDAVSATSAFRAEIDQRRPSDWTVTIWTYPDSFAEFRRLRKELYHLGFAIAGRPLPEGVAIGGSPHGSKSSAE